MNTPPKKQCQKIFYEALYIACGNTFDRTSCEHKETGIVCNFVIMAEVGSCGMFFAMYETNGKS